MSSSSSSTHQTRRFMERKVELMVVKPSEKSLGLDLMAKLVLLVILTASLLFLPLVLPPLSPPPLMLLLVPVGILAVLMLLAVFPSNLADIVVSPV
ncbi:hypothetical protein ACHQM5_001739 [Ranunculus cassubicifolius]